MVSNRSKPCTSDEHVVDCTIKDRDVIGVKKKRGPCSLPPNSSVYVNPKFSCQPFGVPS